MKIVLSQLLLLFSVTAFALDAGDFDEVNGYTVIAITNVDGDFEGADFDRPVLLTNGMIFRFDEYAYSYAYQPDVVVFARRYTMEDMKRAGIKNPPQGGFTSYKLLIDETFTTLIACVKEKLSPRQVISVKARL